MEGMTNGSSNNSASMEAELSSDEKINLTERCVKLKKFKEDIERSCKEIQDMNIYLFENSLTVETVSNKINTEKDLTDSLSTSPQANKEKFPPIMMRLGNNYNLIFQEITGVANNTEALLARDYIKILPSCSDSHRQTTSLPYLPKLITLRNQK
ncbi:hypothetical protein NPIL_665061 [Nephila pilipes]|uniref:Uncharacterized protein n=1 Tax=Nephila pilipes TaxID=299642 RepID=A0A8X6QS72_NEPPI|nr:hypothetical protein NPIL_665061 [Nephila pilipes]